MPTRDPSRELVQILGQLKLGKLLPTLPERLRVARERELDPEDVLLTILGDEVHRRARQRTALRAARAGLDPRLVFDAWDDSARITYDRRLLDELRTLRFLERHHHVLIVGPVGVGKTMLAHALGHLAVRAGATVHCESAHKLLLRLKAARLDASHDLELRRLVGIDLLVVDDFALRPLDATETSDFHELVALRHETGSMIVTSNRDGAEWLAQLADPLLGQAMVDRFTNHAYDLVLEGESYRPRQKPRLVG